VGRGYTLFYFYVFPAYYYRAGEGVTMEKIIRRTLSFSFILAFMLLVACASFKYQDDFSFGVSAQADSPEFPVYINGKMCLDTDNIPGLCSKRISSNEALIIRLDARTYSYSLQLACTRELNESQSFHVESGKSFEYAIKPEKFTNLKSFTCIGEVFPDDRSQPLSAKWEVRVKVVDKDYVNRETAYFRSEKGRRFLVMGAHARTVNVQDEGVWHTYIESPVIEIKGDSEKVMAFSESHNMRFNSIGFKK